jgi:hypothetical protein
MGLTRPNFSQINTRNIAESDPMQVLNAGSTQANVDVGFLINRDGGVSSNVALFWNESSNSFVTAFTTSTGATNANITVTQHANLTAGNVYADAFFYANGSQFVSGGNVINTGNVTYVSNTFGNANVAAYLPTYAGTIAAINAYVDRGSDANDWNTLTSMGVYLINRTSWSGTTNTPLNTMIYTGQLEVVNTGNVSITQNYRPYSNTAGQDVYWTRSKYSTNAWTAWVEIINGAEIMDGGSF